MTQTAGLSPEMRDMIVQTMKQVVKARVLTIRMMDSTN